MESIGGKLREKAALFTILWRWNNHMLRAFF
mgnify:CR=1 FL=1